MVLHDHESYHTPSNFILKTKNVFQTECLYFGKLCLHIWKLHKTKIYNQYFSSSGGKSYTHFYLSIFWTKNLWAQKAEEIIIFSKLKIQIYSIASKSTALVLIVKWEIYVTIFFFGRSIIKPHGMTD